MPPAEPDQAGWSGAGGMVGAGLRLPPAHRGPHPRPGCPPHKVNRGQGSLSRGVLPAKPDCLGLAEKPVPTCWEFDPVALASLRLWVGGQMNELHSVNKQAPL